MPSSLVTRMRGMSSQFILTPPAPDPDAGGVRINWELMPRILVTNDDGIYSEGIRKLAKALAPLGEIVIVAPDREQSAASHALTLNRPLRLLQLQKDEWIVDGTPTDCVNLAVLKLMKA